MSEKAAKPKDVVTLDLETILQTTEARRYINQLKTVSQILGLKDSQVSFKGEEVVSTGYVGDCKSVHLYKCPKGYFLFFNKAATKNNWSEIGDSEEAVIKKVYDPQIREKLMNELSAAAASGRGESHD